MENLDGTIKDAAVDGRGVAGMVEEARARISKHILHTPLLHTVPLSTLTGAIVYLKLESEQVTGSFKVRGAFNRTAVVGTQTRGGGTADGVQVITASTGNHGLACAMAFRVLGVKGRVVVPVTADAEKKQKIKDAGAEVLEHGSDCVEGEEHARSLAQTSNLPFISPYNDYLVIAGQGTIGMEILEDLPDVAAVYVSVGGGGLISGIAAYIKHRTPQCKVIGCSPARSKVMHESVRAGRIVHEASGETLSDATAGGLEQGTVTFPLCQSLVDEWVLVDEEEIAKAIFYCLKHHKKVVEGSAGVAVAAVGQTAGRWFPGRPVVAVVCGANISLANLQAVLNTHCC